jgi:hypothetical protein
MRIPVAGAAVLLLAACGGAAQPVQLTGPVPSASDQALRCATQQLAEHGYDVSTDQTGVVRGVHINTVPWWRRIFGIDATADQITAMVNGGQLQVTAVSSDPTAASGTAVLQSTATTSGAAREDARAVLAACTAK